jgi:hypothetical protein
MNTPITMAHLCGPLGQALAVVNDETWLYENSNRRRASANDIRFFFELGLEVRTVRPSGSGALTENDLSAMLELETRRFKALQGLLIGMDSEIDDDLRKRSMRRANRLLADGAVAEFVARRFLKPVSEQTWHVAGARRLAGTDDLSVVARFYAIVDGPFLLDIEKEIGSWASEQGYMSVRRAVEIEKAYDAGLVAALAIALYDNMPNEVAEKIFLAKNATWDRRLATHLVGRLIPTKTLPEPPSASDEDNEEAETTPTDVVAEVRSRGSQLLDESRSRKRRQGHRRRDEVTDADGSGRAETPRATGRFDKGVAAYDRAVADFPQTALQDPKAQIPGIDLTFADGKVGRIWGVSGIDDLGGSFTKAGHYLRQRARQDGAFHWTIVLELDLVIPTAVIPLLGLIRTLNAIIAEKPDRRSIALEWRVKFGDGIMGSFAKAVKDQGGEYLEVNILEVGKFDFEKQQA